MRNGSFVWDCGNGMAFLVIWWGSYAGFMNGFA